MRTNETTISHKDSISTLIEVLQTTPDRLAQIITACEIVADVLTHQPGFVSVNLHRSLDDTHIVTYVQWRDADSLNAAYTIAQAQPELRAVRDSIASVNRDIYDVVHTKNITPGGITSISLDYTGATFINVISTTPDMQQALLGFVIGNDAKGFSDAPGYQSANFHRGHSGTTIINYSHWDTEHAFLDAIGRLLKTPNVTMEQANQIATAGAGGLGQTDFRFYEVVYSRHAVSALAS